MDLSGKCFLVTGASSGIGRETAIVLSRLGARLVLTGRNTVRLEETRSQLSGTGHVISSFDITEAERIPPWMKSLAAESGPFHGLVHAAGKQLTMPVKFLTEPMFTDLVQTNLSSALMLARGYSQKPCRASGSGGSIVYISSVMGILTGKPGISAYAATKAALVGMTRSLALEFSADRIRVNCVCPAFVQTNLLEDVRQSIPENQFAALEQAHPLGFGTPQDVAHAISFLLADTGRWITGTTLIVDGGYSVQ